MEQAKIKLQVTRLVAVLAYFGSSIVLLLLLSFAGLHWLQIPTGSFLDWVIGVAIFAWLIAIVTVPWNIHFEAKEALSEAELSIAQNIPVDPDQINYIKQVQSRSLWIVIALHLSSAAVLYGLAIAHITPIGYIGSGAALLLTALRPAVRTYRYFAARIAMLRQQFKYPRQDVLELRDRVSQLEAVTQRLEFQLDPDDRTS